MKKIANPLKPGDVILTHPQRGIGIYSVKSAVGLTILGTMDPALVYAKRLTFKVGDGTKGDFPLCGPISDGFGCEAVDAWREVHDKERLDREVARLNQQFERFEAKRLSEEKTRRQARARATAG